MCLDVCSCYNLFLHSSRCSLSRLIFLRGFLRYTHIYRSCIIRGRRPRDTQRERERRKAKITQCGTRHSDKSSIHTYREEVNDLYLKILFLLFVCADAIAYLYRLFLSLSCSSSVCFVFVERQVRKNTIVSVTD